MTLIGRLYFHGIWASDYETKIQEKRSLSKRKIYEDIQKNIGD